MAKHTTKLESEGIWSFYRGMLSVAQEYSFSIAIKQIIAEDDKFKK